MVIFMNVLQVLTLIFLKPLNALAVLLATTKLILTPPTVMSVLLDSLQVKERLNATLALLVTS